MYRIARALLFLLPAETAHHVGLWSLRLLSRFPSLCRWLRVRATRSGIDLSVPLGAMRFANPIALAAGFDKDAVAVPGLFALGFGAVEVGTLTPRPQPGNPKPRIFRIPEGRALINRLGFNNHGSVQAAGRLRKLRNHAGVLGVNIGKNKDTPIDSAEQDYVLGVNSVGALGDYLVINASSPNTPGLRTLQEPERLASLLAIVRARLDQIAPGKALLLKIAPDLELEAIDQIVDVAVMSRVDGLITTNTTLARPLGHPTEKEIGGLSGAPLRTVATDIVRRAYARAKGRLAIVGVGGVFTAEDAYEKIRAGAAVVQIYTGFIYEGPTAVRNILVGLERLLRRDGFSSAQDAIGADHREHS